MSDHQFRIGLIDIVMVLMGSVLAVPFALILIVPIIAAF